MKLIVDHLWTRIDGKFPEATVDKATSYFVKGSWFAQSARKGHWDGRKRLLDRRGRLPKFPTGLLTNVTDALARLEWEYELDDQRDWPCFPSANYRLNGGIDLRGRPYEYQGEALDAALQHSRGTLVMATGAGKCLAPHTPVLLYTGELRLAKDIRVGDRLMGPDSKPRIVRSVTRDRGPMYRVVPVKGEPWECNDEHILVLKHTVTGHIIEIAVKDYLKQSKTFKHVYKQFAVPVDFPNGDRPLTVDPYFLGVWLGDGTKSLTSVAVTKPDPEIEAVMRLTASVWGLSVRKDMWGICPTWRLVAERGQPNLLRRELLKLFEDGLCIPHHYLTSDRKNRMELLAGLLDTDGYQHNGTFEIAQKNVRLAGDIAFLARSLGLRVVQRTKRVNGQDYQVLSISGETNLVPTRLPRKQAPVRRIKKHVLNTGFRIESLGDGDYNGFQISGDGRFLLGDFTVTHNTELGAGIINSIQQPSVWLTHRRNLAYQTQRRLSERLGVKVGFVGDGVIDVQDITVCMVQTLDNADADRFTELRELLDRTEVLICDEVHHLASGSDLWYKNLFRMRAPWRYGLTATPEFEGPGIKLIAHTGGEIYRIEAPELVERGVLVPPRIWIDECEILGLDKKMDWRKAYKAGVVLNLARNRKIVGAAKQWGQVEKRPTIILVRQIQHGKTLMDMLFRERVTCEFIHGGVGETQRELVLSALKDGLLDVVVGQVEVMGEGVDLPWLQCGINAVGQRGGGDASDGSEGETGRQTTQILGRLLRRYPGKEHCDILDFADSGHKLLEKASLARLGTYVAQGHAERIQRWSDYDA